MATTSVNIHGAVVIEREHLPHLFEALQRQGYCVVGPTVRDGVVVYEELAALDELPVGWTDEQQGGTYRLKRRGDQALFGYAVGPHSWKQFLFPPALRLWRAKKPGEGRSFEIVEERHTPPKYAFIGVRACELQAMAIQDQVLLGGAYADPAYQARRDGLFVLAVNCGQAGGTCFCASMKTGPKATSGFDLALTEMLEQRRHYFVVEIGTQRGAEMLREVPHQPAGPEDTAKAERVVATTAQQMGRVMDTTDITSLLVRNPEHPRWDEVAGRCLACANCTMVCPTCFCSTVEDVTDLAGEHAERWRAWDSCFTTDFSYIHGGSVRPSAKSRYRQWLTHKLSTWVEQFGTSGCVGCGRCISWCPAAIDLTEEVRAIRAGEAHEAAT